jgi:RNA recognition motif-containing protein
MCITLFVGNFPFDTNQSELMTVFERFGRVESIKLINDRVTGRPRGFGFVKIERGAAQAAIEALHRSLFCGRPLNVREAGPIRREVTLANEPEGGWPLSSNRPTDLFVENYWHNHDNFPSSREKRSGTPSNFR